MRLEASSVGFSLFIWSAITFIVSAKEPRAGGGIGSGSRIESARGFRFGNGGGALNGLEAGAFWISCRGGLVSGGAMALIEEDEDGDGSRSEVAELRGDAVLEPGMRE